MAKFRKKPIVIEAVRWFPGKEIEGVIEVPVASTTDPRGYKTVAFIETLEGRMEVSLGDWVITGVAGERYPCRDDIFRKTYEPVK
jgi:hypothetical protein